MYQKVNLGIVSNPLTVLLKNIKWNIGIAALNPKAKNKEPLNVLLSGKWKSDVSEYKNTLIANTEINVKYAFRINVSHWKK